MAGDSNENIIDAFIEFINDKTFSCIGAKAALAKDQVQCMVAGNMACPAHDKCILDYLYSFIDSYRLTGGNFHSAVILFNGPQNITEENFEYLFWQRLQAISDMDADNYAYDKRVSADPSSPDFSFSLKEEAFYIIGMHPASSRASRAFTYPALIFNPHEQFVEMKETNKYEMIKKVVRKRDIAYSGSVNPMLDDYGVSPETMQYSGKNYKGPWECSLKIKHGD
ncbi:MAG TPA: guanitoxin biosynthesis heme-dependent pre-guanitoxin N-hydroxylase GntA [Chitinophagaceae bacterium]|nr:guanitoxin biosynthesis heme-dependent pre-guanitoxin N-hydroxylase GntA [Chitinophagaceae bacterium]